MSAGVAKKQHSNSWRFLYGKPFPHFSPDFLTFWLLCYPIGSVKSIRCAGYLAMISLWGVVRFSKFPNRKPNQTPKFPNLLARVLYFHHTLDVEKPQEVILRSSSWLLCQCVSRLLVRQLDTCRHRSKNCARLRLFVRHELA